MERAEVREETKRRMERKVARETAEVAAAAVVVVSSEGTDHSKHKKIKNCRYRPRYVRRGGARASGDEGQATSGDDDHDHEGGDEVNC